MTNVQQYFFQLSHTVQMVHSLFAVLKLKGTFKKEALQMLLLTESFHCVSGSSKHKISFISMFCSGCHPKVIEFRDSKKHTLRGKQLATKHSTRRPNSENNGCS